MAKKNSKTPAKPKATTKKPQTPPTPPALEETQAPQEGTQPDPEQVQAIAAVEASRVKAPNKFKKEQEIEIRLKLPGMVPMSTRRVSYADLRNGALSDQLVREMLKELEAQF